VDELRNSKRAASVELLDLGCGAGGSLISATRRFGVEGIGLERDPRFVAKGQEAGLPIYQGDVLELDDEQFPAAKYVMLDNLLEHMPDLGAVEQVLGATCRIASRLVHVRHPSFEDETYLASIGLKQYWTDWPGKGGHTAKVRLHEFVAMAARLGCYHVEIRPVGRLLDSNDSAILPISAPPDQHRTDPTDPAVYSLDRHGPKPFVAFDRPVYTAFDLLFLTSGERPRTTYLFDPETDPCRPFFTWDGEPPPQFLVDWLGSAQPVPTS
jgi:hypothetical protein